MNTEMTEVKEPKAPAKKRRPKPRTKAATAKPPKAESTPYAGITVSDCCEACNKDGCIISGRPYCAHPRKGGLHSSQMQDNPAMRRLNEAKRILGKKMLEVKYDD